MITPQGVGWALHGTCVRRVRDGVVTLNSALIILADSRPRHRFGSMDLAVGMSCGGPVRAVGRRMPPDPRWSRARARRRDPVQGLDQQRARRSRRTSCRSQRTPALQTFVADEAERGDEGGRRREVRMSAWVGCVMTAPWARERPVRSSGQFSGRHPRLPARQNLGFHWRLPSCPATRVRSGRCLRVEPRPGLEGHRRRPGSASREGRSGPSAQRLANTLSDPLRILVTTTYGTYI
jgi:hypothetical protein